MAQTKKRRRSKHRGNAAGVVEVRRRTGRPITAADRKADAKEEARQRRVDRAHRPPTWRGAFVRALLATAMFAVLLILVLDNPATQAIILAAAMMLVYTPLGYYTDLYFYRRRQRKREAGGGGR
jgi:drug/metabolite transporter (DMT)-like permease